MIEPRSSARTDRGSIGGNASGDAHYAWNHQRQSGDSRQPDRVAARIEQAHGGGKPNGRVNAFAHLMGGTRCSASPPSSPCTFNIVSLILSMAREGDRPFGQTSVQFMIVRQRNSR